MSAYNDQLNTVFKDSIKINTDFRAKQGLILKSIAQSVAEIVAPGKSRLDFFQERH